MNEKHGMRDSLYNTIHRNINFDGLAGWHSTTVDDDDDYPESSALDGEPSTHKPEHHTVRFQEEVQVIGLPLRSTTQSRETGE